MGFRSLVKTESEWARDIELFELKMIKMNSDIIHSQMTPMGMSLNQFEPSNSIKMFTKVKIAAISHNINLL